MRTPTPVPIHLRDRTFNVVEARAAGISARMLEHERFKEIYPRVCHLDGLVISPNERIAAARRNLPADARTTHATRLRELGYEHGRLEPLHFVVPRDLHLEVEGIVLHRTVKMPQKDRLGVCAEAVMVSLAATERMIDLIKIGDWLLGQGHMSLESLSQFINTSSWRPGSAQAAVVARHLNAGARSPKESETRATLQLAGLPEPEVNAEVRDAAGVLVGIGDLVYRRWKLLVEYEGRQHALDIDQFAHDIDRYGAFRAIDWDYFQVTNERLARPKAMVLRVHELLMKRGYDGPAPVFGRRWQSLFEGLGPAPRRW